MAGGPNTGQTGTGRSILDWKSNGSGTISGGGTYDENRIYVRFDTNSDPLELSAAIEAAKIEVIQKMNDLGS